jgi:hypothetical protein
MSGRLGRAVRAPAGAREQYHERHADDDEAQRSTSAPGEHNVAGARTLVGSPSHLYER